MGAHKYPHVEARLALGAHKCPHVEARLALGAHKCSHVEARLAFGARKYPHVEARLALGARKYPHVEARLAFGARKCPADKTTKAKKASRLAGRLKIKSMRPSRAQEIAWPHNPIAFVAAAPKPWQVAGYQLEGTAQVLTQGAPLDRLEAFVFGTRLTRITRQLQTRQVDQALRDATDAIVDWGGGTRIGESFRTFNFEWARRVLGQGSMVLVISDGWDRGDVELLGREVGRLRRRCDRLIWLNPLLGSAGYEPLTRGIRAILPWADDFLPVHNLESLEQLSDVLSRLPT